MSARCSPACGYCGRCTAAWERDDEDIEVCPDCHGSGEVIRETEDQTERVPCGECDGRGYCEPA